VNRGHVSDAIVWSNPRAVSSAEFSWVEVVAFSVQLVFLDGLKHRHEPPTSQRSHSAVVGPTSAGEAAALGPMRLVGGTEHFGRMVHRKVVFVGHRGTRLKVYETKE